MFKPDRPNTIAAEDVFVFSQMDIDQEPIYQDDNSVPSQSLQQNSQIISNDQANSDHSSHRLAQHFLSMQMQRKTFDEPPSTVQLVRHIIQPVVSSLPQMNWFLSRGDLVSGTGRAPSTVPTSSNNRLMYRVTGLAITATQGLDVTHCCGFSSGQRFGSRWFQLKGNKIGSGNFRKCEKGA
jgi:hypothetical protein